MRYWWVNQNQTYKHELAGGYLWSPKVSANGRRNPFYEFMREVAPGDLIFCFAGTYIQSIGVAQSVAVGMPKPTEFGSTGSYWGDVGWRIDVKYHQLDHKIRPADYINVLESCLPERYSPLQRTGRGNQGVYLTTVNPMLATKLIDLIGEEAKLLSSYLGGVKETKLTEDSASKLDSLTLWENSLVQSLMLDDSLEQTEREALVVARRGQGEFKSRVRRIESKCRLTHVDRIEHLRASHIKPWRYCGNSEERLSGCNGLLLTPTIDHLFDRGFISFENSGELLLSPVADLLSLERMGVETKRRVNVGGFSEEQVKYLEYHRGNVFLQARIKL
ncbi:HNH endonuclease [bacterium SCSIO 12696]|nr:HNH endonuclease [bacterium SCSIO 12696]